MDSILVVVMALVMVALVALSVAFAAKAAAANAAEAVKTATELLATEIRESELRIAALERVVARAVVKAHSAKAPKKDSKRGRPKGSKKAQAQTDFVADQQATAPLVDRLSASPAENHPAAAIDVVYQDAAHDHDAVAKATVVG